MLGGHNGGPTKRTWKDLAVRIFNNLDIIGGCVGIIIVFAVLVHIFCETFIGP